jgi:hypothetical protein
LATADRVFFWWVTLGVKVIVPVFGHPPAKFGSEPIFPTPLKHEF